MLSNILLLIVIPLLVNVLSNLISGWLSRKFNDKGDNKK